MQSALKEHGCPRLPLPASKQPELRHNPLQQMPPQQSVPNLHAELSAPHPPASKQLVWQIPAQQLPLQHSELNEQPFPLLEHPPESDVEQNGGLSMQVCPPEQVSCVDQ